MEKKSEGKKSSNKYSKQASAIAFLIALKRLSTKGEVKDESLISARVPKPLRNKILSEAGLKEAFDKEVKTIYCIGRDQLHITKLKTLDPHILNCPKASELLPRKEDVIITFKKAKEAIDFFKYFDKSLENSNFLSNIASCVGNIDFVKKLEGDNLNVLERLSNLLKGKSILISFTDLDECKKYILSNQVKSNDKYFEIVNYSHFAMEIKLKEEHPCHYEMPYQMQNICQINQANQKKLFNKSEIDITILLPDNISEKFREQAQSTLKDGGKKELNIVKVESLDMDGTFLNLKADEFVERIKNWKF